MKKYYFFLLSFLFLASCINNQERHGYFFELSDHHLIQEGVTSKERVLRIMGSPTLISALDTEDTWIYYAEDVDNVLFFIPEVRDRTILTLKFDRDDLVKSVEKFDLANEESKMHFNSKFTEVSSNKIGFFKSIFSNVGQVRAAQ